MKCVPSLHYVQRTNLVLQPLLLFTKIYLALCISESIYQTCRGYQSQCRIGGFQLDDCPVMDVIRGGSIF